MPVFEFQIVAATDEKAQQFMEAARAKDVVIEDWESNEETSTQNHEYYGFGVTSYSPKRLQQIADSIDVVLVYAKNKVMVEEEDEVMIQRMIQANKIVREMNLTSDHEIIYRMLETYKKLADDSK